VQQADSYVLRTVDVYFTKKAYIQFYRGRAERQTLQNIFMCLIVRRSTQLCYRHSGLEV